MRFRSILFLIALAAASAVCAGLPHTASGTIRRVEHFHSNHVDARTVDVWLPDGYSTDRRYAVLYMNDGQLLFDSVVSPTHGEWGVDETLGRLMAAGTIRNTIVVGIWHTGMKRHIEYFPQKPFFLLSDSVRQRVIAEDARSPQAPPDVRPISDSYLRFIVEELKPYVDSAFSTLTDRENTYIAGSSMGGLISIYAICEYPEVFGGAACLSTHWVGRGHDELNPAPGAFMRYLSASLPTPEHHKIYFDYGTKTLDSLYKPFQMQVDTIMRAKGYTARNWMTKEFPGDDHSERSWRKRLALPVTFLLER